MRRRKKSWGILKSRYIQIYELKHMCVCRFYITCVYYEGRWCSCFFFLTRIASAFLSHPERYFSSWSLWTFLGPLRGTFLKEPYQSFTFFFEGEKKNIFKIHCFQFDQFDRLPTPALIFYHYCHFMEKIGDSLKLSTCVMEWMIRLFFFLLAFIISTPGLIFHLFI